ncbi:MAG: excinuclease ABC subunit UvrC [Thermodesulfovibrionales bacterium]
MLMKEKLSHIPAKPGVYILKGLKDRVLYVGKAKNLKNRLKVYFQRPESLDMRKSSMVKLIKDFSYIITENELEALVLEANLIKQYKPRFNVILRDDKNYPYLRLTVGEQWPRVEVTRRITKDASLYFGPYVPSQSMWNALAVIRKNFPIRTCRYNLDKPMRPCVQYQMGRCAAPCAGLISRNDYMKIVDEVRLFLKGERGDLLNNLEKKMIALSNELKFEEAARIRDTIKNLKHVWESQRVIAPELGDLDVIGFYSDNIDAVFNVFFIRNGTLIGTKDFYLKDTGRLPRGEVIHSFIEMFYAKEIIPPEEIIVGNKPDSVQNLKTWLRAKKGKPVDIKVPREGKRLELLKMANENAAQIFDSRKIAGKDEVLKAIRERLKLPFQPHSIGAFDVSTTSGSESVGAFIYWSDGKFLKDLYRHLRIRGVSGIDDYSMMDEVITRTMRNLGDRIPDLIVIDGGKGQLEIARAVIEANEVTLSNGRQPMLVAISKDPDRALTPKADVIDLEDKSPSSLLLKKIRDEVHRFAISYHRKLRDRRLMESPLERIPGIGKKRRLELLRNFGSIDAIRDANIDDIARLKFFNKKIAENLLMALRRQ